MFQSLKWILVNSSKNNNNRNRIRPLSSSSSSFLLNKTSLTNSTINKNIKLIKSNKLLFWEAKYSFSSSSFLSRDLKLIGREHRKLVRKIDDRKRFGLFGFEKRFFHRTVFQWDHFVRKEETSSSSSSATTDNLSDVLKAATTKKENSIGKQAKVDGTEIGGGSIGQSLSSTSLKPQQQTGQKQQQQQPAKKEEPSKIEKYGKLVLVKSKDFVVGLGGYTWQFIKNPLIVRQWGSYIWTALKDMAHHTYIGFKLLGVEIKTSYHLVSKRLQGHQLTRRERRQLVRTTADLARVGPFLFFILVPFMEFLLPVVLKIFPNMLPSTFQDSYKREEDMKRTLKLRIELASFLQEMVAEMETKVKKQVQQEDGPAISVDEVEHVMSKVRNGALLDQTAVLRLAKLFNDEIMTDNMSRSQLVTLCRYMGLTPYGGDQFLRFQLRTKLNGLREDDATIFFEGIDSLNLLELKQACQDRGMRATGLTMHQLRTQLKRWIDLSVNKSVPIAFLVLSRVFTLQQSNKEHIELAISEAISQMDEDVLQEALIEGAKNQNLETDPATLSRLKLEAIQAQNDLIESEIREKARKQQFLEKLREKAQAELESSMPKEQQKQVADTEKLEELQMQVEMEAKKLQNLKEENEELMKQQQHQATREDEKTTTTTTTTTRRDQKVTTKESSKEPESSSTAAATDKAKRDEKVTKQIQNLTPIEIANLESFVNEELKDARRLESEILKLEKDSQDIAKPIKLETSLEEEAAVARQENEKKDFASTLESIKILASDSPLQAEKEILESILEKQEELDALKAVNRGRIIRGDDESSQPVSIAGENLVPEKRLPKLLRNRVKSMLEKLETDLEKIDEKIGRKLKVLDLDADGKISNWEVREAIVKALKNTESFSDEKADRLIEQLDLDRDGIISLDELDKILEKIREEQEHEHE